MGNQNPNSMEIQKVLTDYIMGNSNFDAPQDLEPDDNLLEGGILDSLGIAEITEYMEKTFTIEIDEDDIPRERNWFERLFGLNIEDKNKYVTDCWFNEGRRSFSFDLVSKKEQ